MKKITYTLAGLFLLIGSLSANAQMEMSIQDCTVEYNLFKGDVQQKKYDAAKPRLDNLMKNCADLSIHIYIKGEKLAKHIMYNENKDEGLTLLKKVYDARILNFPNKGAATLYDKYATLLVSEGASDLDEEVFGLIEKAYKIDPTDVSTKNMERYFNVILQKNKNVNDQKILDTYDDINDALEGKLDSYKQKLSKLISKEQSGGTLSAKEEKGKSNYETILTNIGSLAAGLDDKIDTFLTCDRLIPLYRRDLEVNRNNAQWLRRSVSKMFHKECTGDALYEDLVEAYANAEPSAASKIFYATLLEKRGKTAEAAQMRKEAFDLETDPTKKSNLLLKDAQDLSRQGKSSDARRQANEALKYDPSNGNAYLLIASMYARSANSCGETLFAKRMVYVAALNKARRAASVDPSMSSKVQRFVNSYSANIPTTQDAFAEGYKSGASYKIGCWIAETVTVQVR